MISRDLLDKLHCPYCGSGFGLELPFPLAETAVRFGILRCACYRYPIIDGIPILRQRSGCADTFDERVGYLVAGDFDSALRCALYCDSPIRPTQSRWRRAAARVGFVSAIQKSLLPSAKECLTFKLALDLHRPAGYANYLFYRAANNSFLAAIPLLLLFKELGEQPQVTSTNPRVLDLNCGVGHASFLARVMFPNISMIATDHDFVNLHLARRYMIPDTPCLCLDAELSLPFDNDFFDGVLCMDGLHYVRSKRALLKDLDRAVRETGIWLFPHLHNALAANVSAGVPLPPKDYQRCFEFLPSRLCIESTIFRDFMGTRTLDLSGTESSEELTCAPVFSLVASRRPGMWRKHDGLGELGEQLLLTTPHLAINPIYQRNGGKDVIHLRMAWPNATLERECEPVKQFLPQECSIDMPLWSRLKSGTLRDEDQPRLEALIQSFVLVPLPPNYS